LRGQAIKNIGGMCGDRTHDKRIKSPKYWTYMNLYGLATSS